MEIIWTLLIGLAAIGRACGHIHSRLLGPSSTLSQMSRLHTSTELNSKHWERKNLIVYPPQQKDEPCRPAEIYHCRRQIKYSKDKMWYFAKLVTILSFIYLFVLKVLLEAQDMGVRNHNRIRYHGHGMFGIMDKVHCHYFVKLVEGVPPKVEQKTVFDQAKEYVEQLRNRAIIHSL
uniref:39S ribosomal protein L22, mitochondrial-like n=1 Tax=Sinocyclocheilus anshuiensis TaxID=1608454 RepID=A0A671S0G0_9TELE